MKKLLIIIIVILAAAVAFVWVSGEGGSCDINYKLCATSCTVKHLDSDAKAAGCKARCAAEKTKCLAGKGTEKIQDFYEGIKEK